MVVRIHPGSGGKIIRLRKDGMTPPAASSTVARSRTALPHYPASAGGNNAAALQARCPTSYGRWIVARAALSTHMPSVTASTTTRAMRIASASRETVGNAAAADTLSGAMVCRTRSSSTRRLGRWRLALDCLCGSGCRLARRISTAKAVPPKARALT